MKSTLLLAALLGVAGGTGGAVLTTAVLAPAPAAPDSGSVLSPATASSGLGEVRAALDDLRRSSEELAMRLSAVEDELSRSARTAVVEEVRASERAVLADELESLLASMEDPERAVHEGLRAQVVQAIEEIEEEEDRERERRREEREAERLERRLAELQERLGLDAFQVDRLRETRQSEDAKREELFRQARAADGGWDRDAMREAMGAIEEETELQIAQILSPAQLQQYEELDRDRGRWRRGRD